MRKLASVFSLVAILGSCATGTPFSQEKVNEYTSETIGIGHTIKLPSDPGNGFWWPYLLYVPRRVERPNMIV